MPVEVTYPGVYVEELPSGRTTISPVATNIAAFVGRTLFGPVDQPITIFNYGEFQRQFGGLQFDYPLSYAVQDFFANGGSQAIIARLFGQDEGDGFARMVFPPSPPPLPDGWLVDASAAKNDTKLVLSPPSSGSEGEPDVGMMCWPSGDRRIQYTVTSFTAANPAKNIPASITIAPPLAQSYRKCTKLEFGYGGSPENWTIASLSGATLTMTGGTGLPEIGDLVAIAGDPQTYAIIAEPKISGTDPTALRVALELSGKPTAAGPLTLSRAQSLPMPDGWEIEEFFAGAKPSAARVSLINGGNAPLPGDQFSFQSDPEAVYVVTDFKPKDTKNEASIGFRSLTGDPLDAAAFCLCCAPQFTRQPPMGVTLKSGASAGTNALVVNAPVTGTIDIGDNFTVSGDPTVYTVRYVDGTGKIWFLPEAATDIGTSARIRFYPTLLLRAANPGEWGNLLSAQIDTDGISEDSAKHIGGDYGLSSGDLFNLTLTLRDARGQVAARERYLNVSVKADGKAGDYPNRLDRVLAADSSLARVDRLSELPPASGLIAQGTGGNDGQYLTPLTYLGNQSNKTGIYLLEKADLFNLLCIPPDRRALPDIPEPFQDLDPTVRQAAAEYCTDRRAFFIVDPPVAWKNLALQGRLSAVDPSSVGITGANRSGQQVARNCAVYFPRLWKEDLLMRGRPALFPPCGAIAGVMAATDIARGIWKAPAGQNAGLANVLDLELRLTDDENGQLNPKGINCLRSFPVVGPVVWGARTLRGADAFEDDYKYVSVRRFTLFVEESLYRSTQWAVFEPNNEALWSSLRLGVGSFLADLARQGALYDYSVQCDASNNTAETILLGKVIVTVSLWPVDPAEFVVLQIKQTAGAKPT